MRRAPRPPDRRRIARRLAAGLSPQRTAELLHLPLAEIEALLAEPGFRELVADHARLAALPHEARLRRLESLALWLLEEAIDEGDAAAAAFVVRERRRRRDPARTLARGVESLAARDRAGKAPDAPARPMRRGRAAPPDPVDRRLWRTAGALRRRLIDEQLARQRRLATGERGHGEAAPATAPRSIVGPLERDLPSAPARPACPEGP
jgi:hypothetical protein